jgi:hypothetical protein
MKRKQWIINLLFVSGVSLLIVWVGVVYASSEGIIGFSGNPNTGGVYCAACHSGGAVPAVTLAGPSVVSPGAALTYTLTIAGGQEIAGGLNVSATAGTLDTLPGATDTQLLSGEITHTAPKCIEAGCQPVAGGEVVFLFNWTAPDDSGPVTLYGAGNSVNLNHNPTGDAAAVTSLDILVADLNVTLYLPIVLR